MINKSNASKFINLESLALAMLSAEKGSLGEDTIKSNPSLSDSNYILHQLQ